MAVTTLVLAILGLVISAISLTWQIVQHALSGSRVRVELLLGGLWPRVGSVVTGPFDMERAGLVAQGVEEWLIVVQVRNVGRMPVDVDSFDVELESGARYSRAGWHLNPELPYRLEPGSVKSFYIPLVDVEVGLNALNLGKDVRGRVGLGDEALTVD